MVYSEAFQEAFRRFEQDVDVDSLDSYAQLRRSFAYWSGKRWRDSYKQNIALKSIGRKMGFENAELPSYFKPSQRWGTTAQSGKHRGLNDKQISIMNNGIRKGNSANQILRQLRREGLGIRRKELLRDIREMKTKSPRANPEKHIPRKYRKDQR